MKVRFGNFDGKNDDEYCGEMETFITKIELTLALVSCTLWIRSCTLGVSWYVDLFKERVLDIGMFICDK
ncbi:hypothetical protein Hanom_Chr12g01089161 [Helianthus anomalus]